MKNIISKLSDCLYNITAGCVLISLFDNKENSFYLSLLALFFAVILNIATNILSNNKGE